MAEEYIGAVVLELDSVEVEIVRFQPRESTGKKPVDTMNSTGRRKGYTQGIAKYDLNMTAVVPKDVKIRWATVAGAKLTVYPVDDNSRRTTYQDVFVTEVGEEYTVDNEARIDIQAFALNKVDE
ncbi:hypothetical protein M942_04485 [Enterobacter ludwigii]|jgi:hypothetical protein|uniref:hypothetical protein n=1 Tax=Enterobacter ludwigii TaxID=299767 RepID=UPI0003D824A2|nr:hypothetical protein [Enterobacter ludwigii]AHE72552.1 hypothetical protein M942_04485 [Enterobacter ludwigii]